jgi:hypothetical protein
MNNNNTNIDEILNECQQNINKALNLVKGNKTEVRTLPVYDMVEINKVLKSTTQNNTNENKSELDKIYWDNNTHSGDELDIVIERIYSSKAVISKINDIFTAIQDKYTNDKDFDEVAEKINNSIDNIIEEFTLELYKAGFTKAVKLMSECYNYNN